MSKHTPGPWLITRKGMMIVKSIGPCMPDEYAGAAWLEVSEADAQLIAAAPEMLEALKELVEVLEGDERASTFGLSASHTMALAAGTMAIAKAEGRS